MDLVDRAMAALQRSVLPAVIARGGAVRVVAVQEGGTYRAYPELPPAERQVEIGDTADPARAQSWAAGSGASGATEPLAAVGTLRPSGVTPASGGGPSHGPSTRTSCPSRRSDRASPSTCPWTPPGMVSE